MDVNLDCIPCIANSLLKLGREGHIPLDQQESLMRRVLTLLAETRYDRSPASLGRDMHRLIREHLQDPDPYERIKAESNREMLELLPRLRPLVTQSDHPLETALRLAMAGNIIDFGVDHGIPVLETIERVIHAELGHDDSRALLQDLQNAESVLYIGDNCGEIVFDKLVLETLNHPNVTFVVRASPILNDATPKEAKQVGIDKLARIITTGEDAPGAIWESSSQEFRQHVAEADVVLSKGQGNLEGLMTAPYPIYYILVAKCDLIARSLGVQKGDFVIKKRSA